MATTITIRIPNYFPPTRNRIDGRHWKGNLIHKQRAARYIHAYALEQLGELPVFEGRVEILITRLWGKGQRALDPDNLESAAKWLVDALRRPSPGQERRRLGVIEDDTQKLCDIQVEQERSNHGIETTLIQITGETR